MTQTYALFFWMLCMSRHLIVGLPLKHTYPRVGQKPHGPSEVIFILEDTMSSPHTIISHIPPYINYGSCPEFKTIIQNIYPKDTVQYNIWIKNQLDRIFRIWKWDRKIIVLHSPLYQTTYIIQVSIDVQLSWFLQECVRASSTGCMVWITCPQVGVRSTERCCMEGRSTGTGTSYGLYVRLFQHRRVQTTF